MSNKNILEQFKLTDKVAIVTGAARGLGQAIAIGLAEAEADVALVDVLSMDETKISETLSKDQEADCRRALGSTGRDVGAVRHKCTERRIACAPDSIRQAFLSF